jgi:hypothetical protein
MIYIEMHLDGRVKVFEQSDETLLLRVRLEAESECEPLPESVEEAHDYMRAACIQLEMFDTLGHARSWVESFGGFRNGEVRAAFGRFLTRRATYCALSADAA